MFEKHVFHSNNYQAHHASSTKVFPEVYSVGDAVLVPDQEPKHTTMEVYKRTTCINQ